jgi:hypothetical protein
MADIVTDTCTHRKCKLWKKYGENCPNYIETQWKKEENGVMQSKTINDCAPKRNTMLLLKIWHQLIENQRLIEQHRNLTDRQVRNEAAVINSFANFAARSNLQGMDIAYITNNIKQLSDK